MASLRKNFSWLVVGYASIAAAQWLFVVIVVKFLGVQALGHYALALAIVSPIFMFTNLSLRSIQATDVDDKFLFLEFLSFRLLTSLLAIVLVGGLLFLVNYNTTVVQILILLTMLKLAEGLSDVCYGVYQRQEQMSFIGKSLLIRSCLLVVGTVAIGWYSNSLVWMVAGTVFLYFAIAFFYDLPRIVGGLRQQWRGVKVLLDVFFKLLVITLPLGITVCVNVLYQSIPRILVEDLIGPAELGVFSGISYFAVIGATVVNALGQGATPKLARLAKEDVRGFMELITRLSSLVVCIGIAGVVFAWMFSDSFLSLVYSEEFLQRRQLFVLLMFVALVTYLSGVLGCGLTALQEFRWQAYISAICLIVLCISSYPLISVFGVIGAAAALCLAYLTKVGMEYLTLRRCLRWPAQSSDLQVRAVR